MPKFLAFLRRDWQTETRYRMSFVMQVVGIGFGVVTFFYVGRLVGSAAAPYLARYGGDYFSFVLIGIALDSYLTTGLTSFVGRLREAQSAGTLEAMLMSPTRPELLIAFSSLWDFAWTTFQIVVYMAIGLVFGLSLSRANFPAALLVLVCAVVPFVALGILAASIIMVTKRGDPLTWMVGSLFTLFGGVMFPVTMLPTWLQPIANFFPTTIALDAMRLALLQGASLEALLNHLIALLVFALILAPVSLIAFRIAVDIARRDGSLAQF